MIKKYEGYIDIVSTLHHAGNEKTGSSPILRATHIYSEEFGFVRLPYLNGNAIRGNMRRKLMYDFCLLIGCAPESINTKIYHMLFTGGALEAGESTYASIDLHLRREIRKLLTPISLYGCSLSNQMIPGKLKVGMAYPVCKEYSGLLPVQLKADTRADKYVREFTDMSFSTRRDDLRADRAENEQAVQMKVDYECFIPGTRLSHWFALEHPSDVETSCFGRLIELFSKSPYLGGKSNSGNGEVTFTYTPDIPDSTLYLKYVDDNKEDIKTMLDTIEGMI